MPDGRLWRIKYYKGLGTSTAAEAKEYFKAITEHTIIFRHSNDKSEDDSINLAFSKTLADSRKDWLSHYDKDVCIDHR